MAEPAGVARDQLKSIIERIEKLEEEKTAIAEDIKEEFDGACAQGRGTEKNALDQLFDKYFLTCVQ